MGVPVSILVFLAMAGTVYAIWAGVAYMRANILGAQAKQLEISLDNATWEAELLNLFSNSGMTVSVNETATVYLRSSEAPLPINFKVEATNVAYIEGAGQGAVIGELIYDYMPLTEFSVNGIDQRGTVADMNGNLGGDLGDIIRAGVAGVSVPYSDQAPIVITVFLDPAVLAVDELNGDAFDFDLEFTAL